MANLIPRRITGQALRLSARAGRLPVVGAGIRAGVRDQLGLSRLHDARLGPEVTPWLEPPAQGRPASSRHERDGQEGP